MSDSLKDQIVSIRLSREFLSAINRYATSKKKDRAQVIREAIAHLLKMPIDPVEERLSLLEDQVKLLREQVKELQNER